jgi:hypothetical protein
MEATQPTTFVSLTLWERLTSGINNAFHVAKDQFYSPGALSLDSATLLGRDVSNSTDLKETWLAQPYFTYRTGFEAFESGLRTDQGWGCMLRTGQMLLANTLIQHRLGRGNPFFPSTISIQKKTFTFHISQKIRHLNDIAIFYIRF